MNNIDINLFKSELRQNLTENILPYWMNKMCDPRGGFYGRRDGYDNLDAEAPKGAILHGRIVWTFSAAHRFSENSGYIDYAKRAADFIDSCFLDKEYGGAFWSVDVEGNPLDTKKQYYAIAFIIYGASEMYLATGDKRCLDLAWNLFNCIEDHARDYDLDGYIEASTREWGKIEDMRLSSHDANASKTMNTHLHILEGYTNLLRALKHCKPGHEDGSDMMIRKVEEATKNLLRVFLYKIENSDTHHLTLFFDDCWRKFDDAESYGHDIEASWLLLESAEVIGDKELFEETLRHTEKIALAGLKGRENDGSMIYELHADGRCDNNKHWWVQAENVIGQLYLAYFHSDPGSEEEKRYLSDAWRSWRYIADNLVDPNGEWYWAINSDSTIDRKDDKAGFWKCPYHNSRMCLESIKILDLIEKRRQKA